jgi:hypothetical protein
VRGGPWRTTNTPLVARRYPERRATRHTVPAERATADSQQVCNRKVVATIAGPCSIQGMSETPEASTQPTSVAAAPPPAERVKPPRVYLAAAWVVIVAGIVFILSVVFFAGALVFGTCHHHHHHHHGMMFKPGGPGPGNGPWQFGGPGNGPWQFGGPGGPGMAPPPFPGGSFGPGGPAGPAQSPTTSTPAPRP